jgi:uncharacterized protein HemY
MVLLAVAVGVGPWRTKKNGRKKIAVDFVNIGKHLISLTSYTRLSLFLCFSNFWAAPSSIFALSHSDLLF